MGCVVSAGVLLYCDEGPGAGLGHRARCEAIAGALRRRRVSAAVLPVGDGIVAAPVVVVDSYRVDADDRHHFVPDVVVAIDDLERDLAVDCVVAPSPGARDDVYTRAGTVLAGAPYALIDSYVPVVAPVSSERARVLVATGAADVDGVGARIAAALHAMRPDVAVELVVGRWGCADVPDGVDAIVGACGLQPELAAADIVITAGGVTLLEALHLGRPCVTFAVAENQLANVNAVGAAGAALVTDIAGVASAATALLDDVGKRAALARQGAALIDGAGADRVADTIVALASLGATRRPEIARTA
jgi:spore coat polysaccharide biosynthesis predicted glycosyltransferase SpsG